MNVRVGIMFWSVCLWCYILLLCSSFTLGLQIHSNSNGRAVAVAGDDASLTCYYSPGLTYANQFHALFWKFAPKNDPATEIEIASYNVSSGPRYSNGLSSKLRLNASWQYGSSLKIMNTSLDDQGDYTCQIATSMGFRDSVITLTVYAVPQFLQISNSSHQHADLFTPFKMTSDEPQTIVCSSFPPTSPATNLSWELDPILKRARNMIHYPSATVMSSRSPSSSSSSSSSGDWEFFSTERRLVLTPRDEDHGAVIRCFGDHPGLPEMLSVSITLSVLVSPSYIRIIDDSFQHLYDEGSVNVTQNSAVTFVCVSTRSRPPTRPRWWIGNDPIEDNVTRTIIPYDDQELYDVSSRMTLPRVRREHHGKEITCSASGLNLRAVATNMTLHVLGPPDSPRITNSLGSFIEGISRSLECIASNGFPPANIEWLIDGDRTPDTETTIVKGWRYNVTSRLTINPDRHMNGKEVTCFARSPISSTAEMQSSIVLNVNFCPRRVSISCEPVVAGRPSMITCESALGNPASRLSWTVDGHEIEYVDVDHAESFNSSNTTEGFIASSVYSGSFDADDNGKIIRCCVDRNANVGCTTDICTECPLNVICKPKLLQERNDMIMSRHEYYITLRCSARGNPSPLIQWYSPWIVHDSPINASTPGVISLVDNIIEGSDRVTIQSTLVIETSTGIDTRVQGVKCMASNSIGSTSTASFFGNTSDVSSVYNQETGLLTVRYSPSSTPLPADVIPCVHVDYVKLPSKQVWKRGTTCFKLQPNETVIQVQTGLKPTEIGLRVCYYEEFCDNPLPPQPSFKQSPRALNNNIFPALVVGILCVILCTIATLLVCRKRGRKVHEQNRHTQGELRSQVSFRRTDQRSHARVEDAVSSSSPLPRGEMNDYMDMTSTRTSKGATTGTTPPPVMMSPFQDSVNSFAYEDMRVDEQASSAGLVHYTAGGQSVDSMVYANMDTSTPLKRSDSGICCTYSISPPQSDRLQNMYASTIFTIPVKLQTSTQDTDTNHGDVYMPITPQERFVTSSPSSNTVASEWNFFPMSSTSRGGQSASRERGGMPPCTSVTYEIE